MTRPDQNKDQLAKAVHRLTQVCIVLLALLLIQLILLICGGLKMEFNLFPESKKVVERSTVKLEEKLVIAAIFEGEVWNAPTNSDLEKDPVHEQLLYGKELVANTAVYFGPKGTVAKLSNGMNCQNCHLQAGTVPFGNNYGAVAATYPKYRARSGQIEDVYKRVSDCFERSLDGTSPQKGSKEMEAIVAYINWLGKDQPKGEKPKGSGLYELKYLDRPALAENGKKLYEGKCVSCHKSDGGGQFNTDNTAYTYPPLWGEHSFNQGAGLFRISRFAGYIKANMPQGVTYKSPQLTDEEAWDIAAYVLSQPRPSMNISADWPNIAEKPVDHPFGPYADKFTEEQHKYGPFSAMPLPKKPANKK